MNSGTAGVTNVAKFDSYLAQSIDFSSGGLAAYGGEAWTTLNFTGTNKILLAPNRVIGVGSATIKGLDVAIIQDWTAEIGNCDVRMKDDLDKTTTTT